MDYIMETVGLRKAYKDNIVVDDVNMHISKGAIYGFVGPNGAGKSTVMKMILSLIQPDAGEVQLLGEKVTSHSYEIFKKVGSIIENPYFYDKMTARQNLELHCEYMGFPNKERIDEVLHLVDLQNVEKTSLSLLVGYETTTCYCKSYSGKARIFDFRRTDQCFRP